MKCCSNKRGNGRRDKRRRRRDNGRRHWWGVGVQKVRQAAPATKGTKQGEGSSKWRGSKRGSGRGSKRSKEGRGADGGELASAAV